MPSVGHLFIGLATARLHAGSGPLRLRPAAALVALAMAPDVDFLARHLGAAPGSPWLHRGALHSVAACLLAAALATWWAAEPGARGRFLLAAAFAATSHPVLDAFTWGGAGIAFLWPLDGRRILAPFHLLEAAPMGARLVSAHGGAFLAREALLFSPLLLLALRRRRSVPPAEPLTIPLRAPHPRGRRG